MVLHNPNNWHWVNKDVAPWARDYLKKDLIGIEAEQDGVSARVDKVLSMDGDVDVSQRKGKVITLFDVKLQLEYSGKTKDDESVSGTITIPEVAHDSEEDEYVFEIEIYGDSLAKTPVKDLVRTQITPQLRKHLITLGPAIIHEHAKDIQHASGSNPSSGFSTPKYYSNSSVSKASPSPSPAPPAAASASANGKSINTTTVTDTEELRTSAAELYATFTDPQRIAAFTRAPPRLFDGATASVGGRFELFDGNVAGEYAALEPPRRIVQRWRLKQWPAGHFSQLAIEFDQNDADGVTVMRVEWTGVPVGQEEVTKRNWREYYVRSIKTTFGFGTIL